MEVGLMRRRKERNASKALVVRLRASAATVRDARRAVQAAEREGMIYVRHRLRCVVGGLAGR
jgi:hypothetical protein